MVRLSDEAAVTVLPVAAAGVENPEHPVSQETLDNKIADKMKGRKPVECVRLLFA
jgi:hypothetical protein